MSKEDRLLKSLSYIKNDEDTCCVICSRELKLTKHHLIPKALHTKKHFFNKFTSEQLDAGIMVCRLCHDAIHQFWTEKELGEHYNTLESLLITDEIKKFILFAQKQKY